MNRDVIAFAHALRRDWNKVSDPLIQALEWTAQHTEEELQMMSRDLRGRLVDSASSLELKLDKILKATASFQAAPASMTSLGEILTIVTRMEKQMAALVNALASLTQQVTDTETVEQSAIVLINGLATQLALLAKQQTIDPAQLQALSDKLNTDKTALAAAILANTPAAPPAQPAAGAATASGATGADAATSADAGAGTGAPAGGTTGT